MTKTETQKMREVYDIVYEMMDEADAYLLGKFLRYITLRPLWERLLK